MTTPRSCDTSFIFYDSFFQMVNCIPDPETRLKAYEVIFFYALYGTEPETDNWTIQMVFCAVKPQIDANSKRRENGKKGGRKAAVQEHTQEEMQEETAVYPEEPQRQEEYREKAAEQQAAGTEITAEPQPAHPTASTQNVEIITYGKNEYPTIKMELDKFKRFTRQLFQTYHGNIVPTDTDVEKVMERTYIRKEIGGEGIAVFDAEKGDLLNYAFEQAKAAGKLNWRYLDGMYRNFDLRDIASVSDALQYDLERHKWAM